ncbi:hypothetical protein ACP3VQ_27805 [Metapseudomonas otitidis]|uniref:Uncharacterized protein n=1 Tax=Pseudomonas tohonis TaxID=2725477 RepID=A0ABQ4WAE6_9PSED|nr:hypothetical protein [Pseudomonas tohonis]GJN56439.1 hypothetical protein TUM20286_61910 [Pseudomonas tohonis]
MTNANRTLLIEMLSKRIRFETEAGGFRFQHSGIVIAWLCPCAGHEAEVGYQLLVRDDETAQEDFYDFHEILLLAKPEAP